jgi:hypothetical protein
VKFGIVRLLEKLKLTHGVCPSCFVMKVLAYRNRSASKSTSGTSLDGYDSSQIDAATAMIEEAFLPLENLITTGTTMADLMAAVAETKSQCLAAVEAMEAANMAQAEGAAQTVAALEEVDGSIDGSAATAITTLTSTTVTVPPELLRADVVAVDFADMALSRRGLVSSTRRAHCTGGAGAGKFPPHLCRH